MHALSLLHTHTHTHTPHTHTHTHTVILKLGRLAKKFDPGFIEFIYKESTKAHDKDLEALCANRHLSWRDRLPYGTVANPNR